MKVKVTVCQWNPDPSQRSQQRAALKQHVTDRDSQFVLLPEMTFSPWLAASDQPNALAWGKAVMEHKTEIAELGEMGAKAIVGTRPIITQAGSRRNQAYVWTQDRPEASGFHDKYYLPNEPWYWEAKWYDRGEKQFDLARALGMKLGVQICTEMWFFEWARHYAAAGADLLLVPRATPHGSTDKWLAGGQSAAVCSGAYCLSSNLYSPPEDTNANLGGLGWIVDPEGGVLATTTPDQPFATAEIDIEKARAAKAGYPRYVKE